MKKLLYLKILVLLSFSIRLNAQTPLFGNEFHVKINGLAFDAMEPFISTDGNALFFNSINDGTTTSLYYASKVNDSTFNFIGPVPVVNQTVTPRLDAVASVDSLNNFYWVSTRNYPANSENLQRVRFLTSSYTNFGPLHGNFYIPLPGWIIMDAGINFSGDQLIYCNAFFNGCVNSSPCRASLGLANKANDSTFNKDSNTNIIMANVNDTANYIVYAPALTKDGLELYYTRLLKNSTQTQIMVATRSNTVTAFSAGSVLIGAPYIVPEAPTLSSDKTKMYYHRKNGALFEIYLRYRTGTSGIHKNVPDAGFEIYPNPTSGPVYIRSNKDLNITVYNTLGDLFLRTRSNNFDLTDLLPGVYIINLSDHTMNKTVKLIKQ
ncbi:MAG: T9SS type A sorting domain-containing protein [Bacteroidetes bacterium]|nr:T9SS type A sorting domain-containing protein [Bacteroidota bacterium]